MTFKSYTNIIDKSMQIFELLISGQFVWKSKNTKIQYMFDDFVFRGIHIIIDVLHIKVYCDMMSTRENHMWDSHIDNLIGVEFQIEMTCWYQIV
jgi:hypothetical protein